MNSETIDLIATDPPFNKSRDFHATPDTIAKGAKFSDRWSWERDVHAEWVDQIKDDWPAVWSVIGTARISYGDDMAAFLCFLGVRLLEMHRLLKSTGSIFLHIDHTAHAYVKALMDGIFGKRQFRNEIVWFYKTGGTSKRWFSRKHDTILFYSKSNKYKFHHKKEKSYLSHKYGFSNVTIYEDEQGYYSMVGMRDVWDIPALRGNQPEATGYPTQKLLELYERIVDAVTDEHDMVLDPFCGCATTPIAAERRQRKWVGIDIWEGAIRQVRQRIQDNRQLLADPDPRVHYQTKPPERTDANEVAAPTLKLRMQRPTETWQRIPHRAIVNVLAVAQSSTDGIVCAGCGRVLEIEFMELDHITTKSDRGTNDITNRILLCRPCNGKKRDNLTLRGLVRDNRKSGWARNTDLANQARNTADKIAVWVSDSFDSNECQNLLQADTPERRDSMTANLRHIIYTL